MSISHRFIAIYSFLFASNAYGYGLEVFGSPVYWKATETVDWVLINDRGAPNQNITYKTSHFNFKPGFKIGIGMYEEKWDSTFYYTKYDTKATATASGNLVSTFLGGKLVQGNLFFYQTGQLDHAIHFNMFDWGFSKKFNTRDNLILCPMIGLRGGWIHQKIVTNFQGPISVTETVKNNFSGIGPKIGLSGTWIFYRKNNDNLGLFSDFTASYLRGRWMIRDVAVDSLLRTHAIKVGSRHFGAFTLEGIVGFNFFREDFSVKLGYEIKDWFNQYQVLDDGTGAHNNDLILQGLTLRLSYHF